MLLTLKRLARENAELYEETKQLQAAIKVYRELARKKIPLPQDQITLALAAARQKTA
jgi:hypothetical protein